VPQGSEVQLGPNLYLTPFNHSNPLHRLGLEHDWLAARGIGVRVFGKRWWLGNEAR